MAEIAKILVAGAHSRNLEPEQVRDPRVVLWSSDEEQKWHDKAIPKGVVRVVVCRFITTPTFRKLRDTAKRQGVTIEPLAVTPADMKAIVNAHLQSHPLPQGSEPEKDRGIPAAAALQSRPAPPPPSVPPPLLAPSGPLTAAERTRADEALQHLELGAVAALEMGTFLDRLQTTIANQEVELSEQADRILDLEVRMEDLSRDLATKNSLLADRATEIQRMSAELGRARTELEEGRRHLAVQGGEMDRLRAIEAEHLALKEAMTPFLRSASPASA